jgi:hypothetical protein
LNLIVTRFVGDVCYFSAKIKRNHKITFFLGRGAKRSG